jgi:hypothetical protein
MREYVPSGKPDGMADGAIAVVGVAGLSASLPPVVGLA